MADYLSPLAMPFEWERGDHGVLLIHGFTGSPAHMRPLGERLRDAGYSVRGVCLPGHGTDPEEMRRVRWQDWLLCCREANAEMRKKYRWVTAAGLSMGGVLALLLAEEGNADCCVPIAAPMKTRSPARLLALAAAPFYPTVNKRADGARGGVDACYDIGYASFPTVSTHHLNVLMRRARQQLSLIRCPVLCVQSRKDEVVAADSPRIILDGVSSEKKAMLWLEDAPHVCTISPECGKIAEAIGQFLAAAEGKNAPEKD